MNHYTTMTPFLVSIRLVHTWWRSAGAADLRLSSHAAVNNLKQNRIAAFSSNRLSAPCLPHLTNASPYGREEYVRTTHTTHLPHKLPVCVASAQFSLFRIVNAIGAAMSAEAAAHVSNYTIENLSQRRLSALCFVSNAVTLIFNSKQTSKTRLN